MRYYLTPVRMAIINKSTSDKCWRVCGEKGPSCSHWWKAVWRYLKKLKMKLPYDPPIPLLGIYSPKTWNTNLKEYMHPCVHCSIIQSSQDVEAAQVLVSRWGDKKLWYLYTRNTGLPQKKKKKEERKPYSLQHHGWTWRALCYVKKVVRERQVAYDFTQMWNLMNKVN